VEFREPQHADNRCFRPTCVEDNARPIVNEGKAIIHVHQPFRVRLRLDLGEFFLSQLGEGGSRLFLPPLALRLADRLDGRQGFRRPGLQSKPDEMADPGFPFAKRLPDPPVFIEIPDLLPSVTKFQPYLPAHLAVSARAVDCVRDRNPRIAFIDVVGDRRDESFDQIEANIWVDLQQSVFRSLYSRVCPPLPIGFNQVEREFPFQSIDVDIGRLALAVGHWVRDRIGHPFRELWACDEDKFGDAVEPPCRCN
jgi:hypothetical protein